MSGGVGGGSYTPADSWSQHRPEHTALWSPSMEVRTPHIKLWLSTSLSISFKYRRGRDTAIWSFLSHINKFTQFRHLKASTNKLSCCCFYRMVVRLWWRRDWWCSSSRWRTTSGGWSRRRASWYINTEICINTQLFSHFLSLIIAILLHEISPTYKYSLR